MGKPGARKLSPGEKNIAHDMLLHPGRFPEQTLKNHSAVPLETHTSGAARSAIRQPADSIGAGPAIIPGEAP